MADQWQKQELWNLNCSYTFLCQQEAVCTVLLDSEKRSDKDLMPISNNFTAVEKLVAILELN